MKQTLLTGWNFMRLLRLGLGIYIAIQAVQTLSILSGVIAIFFLFQALTNTGCCGSNGCEVPVKKNSSDTIEEVEFEEIK
jgi:hypothetical protein